MRDGAAATHRRVLVADDDPAILDLVRAVLKRARYDVDTAANGGEVLAKVTTTRYDVVLLDLMMPEISGFDVLERLPPRDPFLEKFVVIMSAMSPETIAKVADAENVFAALRKPFEIDVLVSTVDACIATARHTA